MSRMPFVIAKNDRRWYNNAYLTQGFATEGDEPR